MAVVEHNTITGASAIHPIWYYQDSDPGAVGARKCWVDTTGGGKVLKQRNDTDDEWITLLDLADAGSGIGETLIDALGDLIYGSADDTAARLAGNTTTTKKFLTQTGDGANSAAPGWNTIVAGDVPNLSATYGTVAQAKAETIAVACSDETTELTAGTAKVTFHLPWAFTLSDVQAGLTTASSSGAVTVDINEGGVSVLSTKLTIDQGETHSSTAATPAVISDSALAAGAAITIDLDGAGSGATGLKVYLIGTRA